MRTRLSRRHLSPTAASILRHLEKWEIGQLWLE
jgi:hypothetical protein